MVVQDIRTLEKGNIYFLYRPKVEETAPEGLEEVQRLFMVLRPLEKRCFRLAVIGHKKLPDPRRSGRRRFWCFIERVDDDPERLKEVFGEQVYETKTRGRRRIAPSRPAGEGVYRILRHGDHTHLAYALELPRQPGEVQEEFNIEDEASYVISIKNPQASSPKGVGLEEPEQANFPPRLQTLFGRRRFVDADPPDFLDFAGTEFLLIAASEDVSEELGIELHPEAERLGTAEIFSELRLERSGQPLEPLLKGKWR